MNKKGFVLMETIIVIVVISVALLTLFSSYNKILTKAKTENKYDTSEYIYITKYLKDYLSSSSLEINISNLSDTNSVVNYADDTYFDNNTISLYGIEKVYILSHINSFAGKERYFDAYMIDYIKKLDVSDEEELFIVEYSRPVRNIDDYSIEKDYRNNANDKQELKQTYIASLRW